ncbi:MAG TPA: recombinase family protein [Baekduia sp.]|nr:recombinase family protein [Baekduia sp.]
MRTKTRPVPPATVPVTTALAYVPGPEDPAALAAACETLGLELIGVADAGLAPSDVLDALAGDGATCLVVRSLSDLAGADGGLAAVLDRVDADGLRLVALDVGLDTAAATGQTALRRRARPLPPWLRVAEEAEPAEDDAPVGEGAAPADDAEATPVAERTPIGEEARVAEPTWIADEVPVAEPSAEPPRPAPPPLAPVAATAAIGYATASGSRDGAAAAMRAQREAIEERCGDGDLQLLELVGDRESGDRKALDRPGLSHALERLAAGEAACLVVTGLDRLSRSVAELGRLLRWLDRLGVRLVALDLGLDTSTESGRTTIQALASVGEWEHERLSERTRAGLAAARAKRHAPTGAAAERTVQLHRRIAAMRADGMTLQAIADVLNAEGVPTQRGGAKWRPSSVQCAAGYKRPSRTRASVALPEPSTKA